MSFETDYDTFKLLAFTQGVNPQLIETVKPWVIKEIQYQWMNDFNACNVFDDLGYAELEDIITVEQGMKLIKDYIYMATTMETDKKTERAKQKFYRNAGGRVGKGVYRIALKTFYLTLCKK